MKATQLPSPQRILVIGASGGTGRRTCERLVEQGHVVTAFVRRAGSLDELDGKVRVALGDVLQAATLDDAIRDQDAVVVVLGIRENPLKVRFRGASQTSTRVRSEGTRNIISAMRRQGVKRLVVQSTYGVGDTREGLSWMWRNIFDLILKPQIEDTERQEQLVSDSDLDWVLVRPVGLNDGPAADPFVSPAGEAKSMAVSRAAVARVLADATWRQDYVGERLAVSA